jgi:hypothetical protein
MFARWETNFSFSAIQKVRFTAFSPLLTSTTLSLLTFPNTQIMSDEVYEGAIGIDLGARAHTTCHLAVY